MNSDIKFGKFMSFVLRHHPEDIGITLDAHGWADVNALIAGIRKTYPQFTRDVLERIVRENNKQRYSFNDDKTKIRANQGHSIDVDVVMKQAEPPEYLYHGTAERFLNSIRQQGLTRQHRQYVHLSQDADTAVEVGRRHGSPVVLKINASAMYRDGLVFHISENGVWQCENVPWKYIIQ
jgi:putative RNA 2'-phosphotransferase